MFDFDALSHLMMSRTVLCVGDLMLDSEVMLVDTLPGFSTTPPIDRARGGRR